MPDGQASTRGRGLPRRAPMIDRIDGLTPPTVQPQPGASGPPGSSPATPASGPPAAAVPDGTPAVLPADPVAARAYDLAAVLNALAEPGGQPQPAVGQRAGAIPAAVMALRAAAELLPQPAAEALGRVLQPIVPDPAGKVTADAVRDRLRNSGVLFEAHVRGLLEGDPQMSADRVAAALPDDLRVLLSRLFRIAARPAANDTSRPEGQAPPQPAPSAGQSVRPSPPTPSEADAVVAGHGLTPRPGSAHPPVPPAAGAGSAPDRAAQVPLDDPTLVLLARLVRSVASRPLSPGAGPVVHPGAPGGAGLQPGSGPSPDLAEAERLLGQELRLMYPDGVPDAEPEAVARQIALALPDELRVLLARLARAPHGPGPGILATADSTPPELAGAPAALETSPRHAVAEQVLAQQLQLAREWLADSVAVFELPLRVRDEETRVLVRFHRDAPAAGAEPADRPCTVSLQVDCDALGAVHADVRWQGRACHAAFFAERAEAVSTLEAQLDTLREGLGAVFSTLTFEVSLDAGRCRRAAPPSPPPVPEPGSIVSVRT